MYLHYTQTKKQLESIVKNGFDLSKFGQTARRLHSPLGDNNPKAIWNLANLTMPAMSKRQYSSIKFNTTLGKAMLLGYDWDGQIDLVDKEAMDKFNAYVGSGEEK